MVIVNGILTAILIVLFLGIWIWAWSSKNKNKFAEMSALPLENETNRDVEVNHE